LEAFLIKTHQPLYNSRSKDDKSGCFITINLQNRQTINIVHTSDISSMDPNEKIQIFGPYQSSSTAKSILGHIRQIFGYCQNPTLHRPCFYYHLHQCPGPCAQAITQYQYLLHLNKIKHFLRGEMQLIRRQLKKKIITLSEQQNFEQASSTKGELERLDYSLSQTHLNFFLEYQQSRQIALHNLVHTLGIRTLNKPPHRIECFDIAHLQNQQRVGGMSVLIDGEARPDLYRLFLIRETDGGDQHALKEIVSRRLKHPDWGYPDLIVLDGGTSQLSVVSRSIPPSFAIIALSKQHEEIHYYRDGTLINKKLPMHCPEIKILQTARDEVHRFTNNFHRKRFRRQMLQN